MNAERRVIFNDAGLPTELRYYEDDVLTARLGVIVDGDNNFIGLRDLDVDLVSPQSWTDKVARFLFKPKKKIDVTTIDFIGLINWINTIKTIKNIENIENIESLDLIDLITRISLIDVVSQITNIGNVQSLDLIDRVSLIDLITTISTISSITNVVNIANIQSLDLIDRITLIDTITNIGTIGTINNVASANVKTSGGTNIVVDKLNVEAYTERRSTISNNGAVPSWLWTDGPILQGKFFPRGCRGFINTIDIYCKDNAAAGGIITVRISPHPNVGAVASEVITVPVEGAAAWRSAIFNCMWNYDSLFIWLTGSNTNMYFGHDADTPHDRFDTVDSGLTWRAATNRLWIRVVIAGETCGDVPVSGTVNNIEIPNLASSVQAVSLAVPANSELLDTIRYGSGRLLICYFYTLTAAGAENLYPRIYCDGVSILPLDRGMLAWNDYTISATSPEITITKWDTTNHRYTMLVAIKFPFKRSLQIGFFNAHEANACTGFLGYCYEKIS